MTSPPPRNRHIGALFTYLTLIPLVYYIPPWLSEHASSSRLITTALALAIIVPIVAYVVVPAMFRLYAMLRTHQIAQITASNRATMSTLLRTHFCQGGAR